MLRFAILLCLFSFCAFSAEPLRFMQTCRVLSAPSLSGKVVCTKDRGVAVNRVLRRGRVFSEILTDKCQGYVLNSCFIRPVKTSYPAFSRPRRPPEKPVVFEESAPFALGLSAGYDSEFAKPQGAQVTGTGWGYAVGLLAQYRFSPDIRFLLNPTYESIKLGRDLGATGSLTDGNPIHYDQKVGYLGVNATLGYRFLTPETFSGTEGWAEAGAEYLLPLSATQTTASGGSSSFTAQKLVFLVLGPSMDYRLSPTYDLSGSLDLTVNVANLSATGLWGLRLLLALKHTM